MREMALRVLVPPLVRRLDARRIWLFGSVAQGVPSKDSDLDVLVEVGENAAGLPFKERAAAAYDVVADAPLTFGCDVIPWTTAELAAKHRAGGPFFRTLLGGNGSCFMSVDADLAQAMRRFNTARGDLDTGRALLGLKRYAPACFHAQQAAEKAFKGLLVATGRLPKTHFDRPTLARTPRRPGEVPAARIGGATRQALHRHALSRCAAGGHRHRRGLRRQRRARVDRRGRRDPCAAPAMGW